MKPKLFFGTNNAHKLTEIHAILGEKFDILSFKDVPALDVEETEPTLEGNAALKAHAFFAHTNIPCFADDTGLMVNALNGEPGVYSARYAGENCSFADNVALLLKNLAGKSDRSARFVTVIAFYDGKEMRYFEGEVKGEILTESRGTAGFGYDPVFLPEGKTETFAEMSAEEKHAISHRGRAVRKFAEYMLNYI